MEVAKALASLRICAGLPEPSFLDNAISTCTKISNANFDKNIIVYFADHGYHVLVIGGLFPFVIHMSCK